MSVSLKIKNYKPACSQVFPSSLPSGGAVSRVKGQCSMCLRGPGEDFLKFNTYFYLQGRNHELQCELNSFSHHLRKRKMASASAAPQGSSQKDRVSGCPLLPGHMKQCHSQPRTLGGSEERGSYLPFHAICPLPPISG